MSAKPKAERTAAAREKRKARYTEASKAIQERGGGAMIPDQERRAGLPLRTNVEPWKRKRETYPWECPECGQQNAKHWNTCSNCNGPRAPKEEG